MQKSPYQSRVKIFLDGADRSSMVEMAKNPLVQGFTTNPSLMKKAGVKDYKAFCQEILTQIGGKPISFEVFTDDFASMEREAREIASWGGNTYIKIPITNTKGESAIPLIRKLSGEGFSLNVTAIMPLSQVREVAGALNPKARSIVSVFAGRIADTGVDPVPLMREAVSKIHARMLVVVVLPCVPQITKRSRPCRNSSWMSAAIEVIGIRSSSTTSSSGLPREIALPTTTRSGRGSRFFAAYGSRIGMPIARS